ncbi:MAG: response regulator [Myxococcota bacterium]
MSVVSFSDEQLRMLFPFYLKVDSSGALVDLGPSLRKALPSLRVGDDLKRHFTTSSGSRFEIEQVTEGMLYALRVEASGLLLRGQFVLQPGSLLFLASPWISDVEQVRSLGLTLRDFAVHDPMPDYLTLMQTTRTSMQDSLTLADRLAEARDEAERMSAAKSEFLAVMSHEMRTPLNVIMGMSELLADTTLSVDQRRYVRSLLTNSENLRVLICDVLDVSKIEEGQVELEYFEFDLRETMEEVVSGLATRALHRGVELVVDFLPDAPVRMMGDPARVRQILTNLVGNAIKFTEEGYVRVWAEGVGEDVAICVEDSGVGIPEDQLDAIFERFEQAKSATSRFGGTGLGLHITRSLAELMGGSVSVESTLGVGSTFSMELPVGEPTVVVGPKREWAHSGVVVIAAMEPSLSRDALGRRFAEWGIPVVPAASKAEAVAAHEQNAAAIVIVDESADVHGTYRGVYAALRARGARVLQLLPFDQAADLKLDHRHGFVHKPATRANLWEAVSALAERRPTRHRRLRDSLDAARGSGTVLVAEDNEANALLVRRIVERQGYSVHVAPNGLEAVTRATSGEEAYAAILMDIEMPKKDGIHCIREIREFEALNGRTPVPIFVLTAHALSSYRRRAIEAGATAFLTKPLQRTLLLETLAAWCTDRSTVLVVDDDLDSRLMHERVLYTSGRYRSLVAETGQEALLAARSGVDAVLLDVDLPDLPGWAVTRRLRAFVGDDVPIFIVTGHSDAETVRRCRDAGATRVFEKPTRAQRVLDALDRAIDQPHAVTDRPVRAAIGRLHVDSDVADLLPGFLERRRADCTTLRYALIERNFERLRRVGHNLKGSSSGYGMADLGVLGGELEAAAGAESFSDSQTAVERIIEYIEAAEDELASAAR